MNGIFIWTDFGADYGDTGGSQALNYHRLDMPTPTSIHTGGCSLPYDLICAVSVNGIFINEDYTPTVDSIYNGLGSIVLIQ